MLGIIEIEIVAYGSGGIILFTVGVPVVFLIPFDLQPPSLVCGVEFVASITDLWRGLRKCLG